MNILIVDDSATIRDRLREMLSILPGVERVDTAATASDARRCLESAPPDVVVLDIHLPQGSGIEVLDALQAGARSGHGDRVDQRSDAAVARHLSPGRRRLLLRQIGGVPALGRHHCGPGAAPNRAARSTAAMLDLLRPIDDPGMGVRRRYGRVRSGERGGGPSLRILARGIPCDDRRGHLVSRGFAHPDGADPQAACRRERPVRRDAAAPRQGRLQHPRRDLP